MAETPLVFEIATFAVLAVFFVVDLFIIGRKPHVPSTKECVQHIAFFVVMALIFGGLMVLRGIEAGHRILFGLAYGIFAEY